MTQALDRWIYAGQARRQPAAIGSVTPSGRQLAARLALPAAELPAGGRILEVGAGTGAVTRMLLRRAPRASVTAVEPNQRFARLLAQRYPQVSVYPAAVQDAALSGGPFPFVVCGIPFANLPTAEVRAVLGCLRRQLADGGTLTWFRYLGAVATDRVLGRRTRERRAANRVLLQNFCREFRTAHRAVVASNLPPAEVFTLRGRGLAGAGRMG
ncbi:methyltransferase domain-containing protein [Nakamurella aerolata]|uniref:Methyltransferase domain-containing protein n=1 Tax=Nakamurella aerolata TaxID=1656892 RepID=A0A849ADD2_9ACTN|nr:methyltransferase domain-containing protein [Nakamurella aerolata]NNG34882.1 methyltransferase domain-containing protein [Nakamurella aerolata]